MNKLYIAFILIFCCCFCGVASANGINFDDGLVDIVNQSENEEIYINENLKGDYESVGNSIGNEVVNLLLEMIVEYVNWIFNGDESFIDRVNGFFGLVNVDLNL